MKKLLSIILVMTITLTFAACASRSKSQIKARDDIHKLINVEDEISKLTNVAGNIFVNESEAYKDMIEYLLYQAQETAFRGSMIVATDDDVIFASGTRLSDINGDEVDPYTTYEIGSMTKSFTAVCIMKLIEDGRLSMEDTLGDLYPEYRSCPNYEKVGRITISNLLHMRSGLSDYVNAPFDFFGMDFINNLAAQNYEEIMKAADDEIFLKSLFTAEVKYAPDAAYEYCNTNYHILALTIEKLTGKTYEAYVNEVIFKPCGMRNSSAMAEGDITASMHPENWDKWYSEYFGNALSFFPEYVMGTGDIHSNSVDLLKYHRALFGEFLLSEDSMKELLTPIDSYACGWFIKNNVYYHGGDTPGFSSRNYVIERNGRRLYIIVLANSGENRGDVLVAELGGYFK